MEGGVSPSGGPAAVVGRGGAAWIKPAMRQLSGCTGLEGRATGGFSGHFERYLAKPNLRGEARRLRQRLIRR